ncbi:hypothetical protein GCM10020367_43490 [Streptomyces sannanensis]|uniref:Uncharacterized protein n=1 Tax=Streptomyces sannanensis TaxID=285536 RepID=A0ABP6SFT2_9ACTN
MKTASRARTGTPALEAWVTCPKTVRTREQVKDESWRTRTETTKYDRYGLPDEVDETTPGGKRMCTTTSYVRNTKAAGCSSNPDGCAERDVERQVGRGPRAVVFTRAFGWRAKMWVEIPVCVKCQARYGKNQFPPDVTYGPGGKWSQRRRAREVPGEREPGGDRDFAYRVERLPHAG